MVGAPVGFPGVGARNLFIRFDSSSVLSADFAGMLPIKAA
jgi:hypothetical protein